jgi:hypothetical protein
MITHTLRDIERRSCFEAHVLVRQGDAKVWRPIRPSGANAQPYRYRTRDCASHMHQHIGPGGYCIVEVEAEPNMPLMCPYQRAQAAREV